MAPLLPPFLIMTGPRGPEQREGRLSGTASGKGGHREGGREGAETDILFWGEACTWPDTESGPTSPFLQPPGEVSPRGAHGHAHCRAGEMGKGETLWVRVSIMDFFALETWSGLMSSILRRWEI